MTVKTTHFKVDNGDMTLIELESGKKILVDIKIRTSADDPDDETPDVGAQLRERLDRDSDKRLYVDVFLLTHPDQDHICGLRNHFHLGPLGAWSKSADKIVIREMWSSPIIFRRAERKNGAATLCDDAKAWAAEARRRVAEFKEKGFLEDGERILILGEDVDGKTDDLGDILVTTGNRFSEICGISDASFEARLLAPLPPAEADEEEEELSKNNSSVIMQLTLSADGNGTAARYLLGGDAEVGIWERLWDEHFDDPENLAYDVLIAPHHCSWHSLSWDSWSKKGEDAEVSESARNALSQAQPGATILSSSCPIEDDDDDPPCIRAKREYKAILKPKGGQFTCLADDVGDEPFELSISEYGPKPERSKIAALAGVGTALGTEAFGHG